MPQSLGNLLRSTAVRYQNLRAPPRAWQSARAQSRSTVLSPPSSTPVVPPGPFARDPAAARVEAVLFSAREPLTSRKLAQLSGLVDGTAVRTAARRLNRWYDAAGTPFRIEEVAGGLQLLTRPQFASWLRRCGSPPREARLSARALETVAVVAYRQPVLRSEVEAIRGVQCDDILRQLLDRDLVRIVGRAEDLGRPLLYGTTRRFLRAFGLRELADLPRADALRRTPDQEKSFATAADSATTSN